MGITVTESNRLLDAVFATAAYSAPTSPIKLALVTANGSASTGGSEVSGGSYGRQTVTFAAASAESASSNLLARFPALPACVVAGVEVWDSAVTPRRLWWGPATSIAYTVAAATDTFTANGHGLSNNDPVQFITGQAPAGLAANTTYYVVSATTNTFKLSATVAGSAADIPADGSGSAVKCKTIAAGDALEVAVGNLTATLV